METDWCWWFVHFQLLALGEAAEDVQRQCVLRGNALSCGTRLINLLIRYCCECRARAATSVLLYSFHYQPVCNYRPIRTLMPFYRSNCICNCNQSALFLICINSTVNYEIIIKLLIFSQALDWNERETIWAATIMFVQCCFWFRRPGNRLTDSLLTRNQKFPCLFDHQVHNETVCVSLEWNYFSCQGWEETTDASITHLLKTCLAKSSKDQNGICSLHLFLLYYI